MPDWPSLTWPELRRILMREPLGYRLMRQSGSHQLWESKKGYPPLLLAFHSHTQLAPGLVRAILTKVIGLSDTEARRLL